MSIDQSRKIKIAVLGSGPSGLTTAYLLSKKNYQVEVLEISEKIGGLAQSISLWGKNLELGPHFFNFYKCEDVKNIVLELFKEDELIKYSRITSILIDKNQSFSYPTTIKSLLHGLSINQLIKCFISFLIAKVKKQVEPQNAEKDFIGMLGSYFYFLFFKNYSEKIWGKDCSQLDVCYSKIFKPFNNSQSLLKKILRPDKGCTDHIYFNNGIAELWDRMQQKCIHNKVTFKMNYCVTKLEQKGNEIKVTSKNNQTDTYDFIISTLPNNCNRKYFNLPIKHKFNYRNLILVYLKTQFNDVLGGQQSIFTYSKKIKAARITDFSNFPKAEIDCNIILVEYWVGQSDMWELNDNEIIDIVKKDIKNLSLNIQFDDFYIKKIPKAYRIPDLGLPKMIKEESLSLQHNNFFSIGRSNNAEFNYGIGNAINEAIELYKNNFSKFYP